MRIKFIKGIFTPAVHIMSRLWYWQKFVVFIILFTIPVGYATFSYINQLDKSIAFSKKEIIGIQYISPVLLLLQHIQQHRGAASLYLRGDQSFKAVLDGKVQEITQDIARVDTEDQKSGVVFQSTADWNAVKGKWLALEGKYPSMTPIESYTQHTDLISDIIALVHKLGDESNLILDSQLASYEVMNTIINLLPALTENMGRARAFGLSVQDSEKINDEDRKQFIIYANTASIENTKLQNDMRESFGNDPSLRAPLEGPSKEIDSAVKSFISLVEQAISSEKIPMALPEYYAFMTRIINTHFTFSTHLISVLKDFIESRVAQAEKEKQTTVLIIFLSYVLILYFFIGFYLLVARTVRDLKNIAKQLISGRITEVPVLSNDELGEIGKLFNGIGQELIASNNEILTKAQEFKKKSDEFEHMNKFMIDREVKMSELKEEIRKLKEGGEWRRIP